MSHFLDRFAKTNKHLGSWDLWDDVNKKYIQVEVTIEKIYSDEYVGTMGKERKEFIKFKEYPKSMVYVKTNARRLAKVFNSILEEDYIGKKVVLGVETVADPSGGKGATTDGLRFSTRPLPQPMQLPTVKDADFPALKQMIIDKKMTIEGAQSKRTLTPQQLKELQDAVVQG